MRAVLTVLGGLAVLVLSFWLTLKAIDNWPQPAPSDLEVAMAADGFTMSEAIVGSVDVIKRDPSGRLQLAGWAFDKELAQPVSVFVLIGDKLRQIAVTNGPRADVTLSLKQPPEQTKNVAFTGLTNEAVDCGPHTIVAVNQKKHLSILAADVMVPGCTS
jgi:hypothetical protein